MVVGVFTARVRFQSSDLHTVPVRFKIPQTMAFASEPAALFPHCRD